MKWILKRESWKFQHLIKENETLRNPFNPPNRNAFTENVNTQPIHRNCKVTPISLLQTFYVIMYLCCSFQFFLHKQNAQFFIRIRERERKSKKKKNS